MKRSLASLCALAVFLLAGCGGGSSTPSAGNKGGTSGADTATLPITISIPTQAGMTTKRPADISPFTESLAIFVYAQGGTQPTTPTATVNVGAGDSGCTSGANAITCTVDVTAPIGTDELTIEAYSAQNGTGTLLSTTTSSQTVSSGMQAVAVTFSGVPATIELSLETPVLTSGVAGTAVLDVNALDASGALIASPGNFSTPLTISSDSSAVTLSATTASAPGTKITVTYGGAASATYTVHFSATGGGVAANRIVGATLDIVPAESIELLSGSPGAPILTTVASNAGNDAPEQIQFLSSSAASGYIITGGNGFAVLPTGDTLVDSYAGSGCALTAYPSGVTSQTSSLSIGGYNCVVAAEPNNDALASTSGDGLAEYSFSSSGVASATGRTLTLPYAPASVAVSSSGEIAVLMSPTYGTAQLDVYSSGASGSATPLFTQSFSSQANGVAFSSSGLLAVTTYSGSAYQVNVYNASSGASAGTITSPSAGSGSTVSTSGVAFDASNNVFVLQETSQSSLATKYVDMYPKATYGSLSPAHSIPLSTQAGNAYNYQGPVIVSAQAPSSSASSSSAVTGDMLGYEASRTWTYEVNPGFGETPFYVGLYADPQLVSGNVRLIAFESSSTSGLFAAGNEVASGDFTPQNGSYLAAAFSSVASGVAGISGSVPGTPLLVPSSLTLNQNWNPLQNNALANLAGVSATAQVVSVGSVPGVTACPAGSSTTGATVEYTLTVPAAANSSEQISYVPGCGMTSFVSLGGVGTVTLQSVSTDASLGQQTVQLARPAFMSTLHALWQHMLNVHP